MIDWKKVTDAMTMNKALFDGPAVAATTTRLSHRLRKLKIENEILARKRDSIAMDLDRTVVLLGTAGGIERLGAYQVAKGFYHRMTGRPYVENVK